MTNGAAVLGFFRGLFSVEGMIEKVEAKAVARALRIVYFYPDSSRRYIWNIAFSTEPVPDDIAALTKIFSESEEEVSEAIRLLTSASVRSNLRIPLDIQEAISHSVDIKLRIREVYAEIVWSTGLDGDSQLLRDIAAKAVQEIDLLNRQIIEIEAAVQKAAKPATAEEES